MTSVRTCCLVVAAAIWLATLAAPAGCTGDDAGPGAASETDTGADAEYDATVDTAPDGTADSAAPSELPTCTPTCPLSACGADDGCDAPCPACPAAVSCGDCALRLEVTDSVQTDGVIRRLSLSLIYDPPDGAPGPTTAEVRLGIAGPARVVGLDVGAPLAAADKTLALSPDSGATYHVEADGTVRAVVLSNRTVQPVGAGVWWTYDVLLGGAFEAPTEPVALWLRRDGDAIFAPPAADAVIADPAAEAPVAVWPGALLP